MPNYCVNTNEQSNGDHEVHDLASNYGCLPAAANRVALGNHPNCREAVAAARRIYIRVDGCAHCASDCHRS